LAALREVAQGPLTDATCGDHFRQTLFCDGRAYCVTQLLRESPLAMDLEAFLEVIECEIEEEDERESLVVAADVDDSSIEKIVRQIGADHSKKSSPLTMDFDFLLSE
jgi:hypothetical protein